MKKFLLDTYVVLWQFVLSKLKWETLLQNTKLFTFISKVFYILLTRIIVFALQYSISRGQTNHDDLKLNGAL
jgi:hypothetical protein